MGMPKKPERWLKTNVANLSLKQACPYRIKQIYGRMKTDYGFIRNITQVKRSTTTAASLPTATLRLQDDVSRRSTDCVSTSAFPELRSTTAKFCPRRGHKQLAHLLGCTPFATQLSAVPASETLPAKMVKELRGGGMLVTTQLGTTLEQDRQCTYTVTLRRVGTTIVAVEKQWVLNLMFIGPCIVIYFYSKTN